MEKKKTNVDLVLELETRNSTLYSKLIEDAKANHFHDYKAPDFILMPKFYLVDRLAEFPELYDIRDRVIDGEFDEMADEEDMEEMRKYLPREMWDIMGINEDKK